MHTTAYDILLHCTGEVRFPEHVLPTLFALVAEFRKFIIWEDLTPTLLLRSNVRLVAISLIDINLHECYKGMMTGK